MDKSFKNFFFIEFKINKYLYEILLFSKRKVSNELI